MPHQLRKHIASTNDHCYLIFLTQGWIECVGCADRSAYDLTQHTQATGVRLAAEKKLTEPKIVDVMETVPSKGVIGKAFKKEAKIVMDKLAVLSREEVEDLERQLENEGRVLFYLNHLMLFNLKYV